MSPKIRPVHLFVLLILGLLLAACQPEEDEVPLPTRAAVAVLPTATNTAVPTETPPASPTPTETPAGVVAPTVTIPSDVDATETPACVYSAAFVADVTIPDDSVIAPQTTFVKTWRIRNSGTCAWPAGTTFVFTEGVNLSTTNSVATGAVGVGQTVDVAVSMRAPLNGGTYSSSWAVRVPGEGIIPGEFFTRVIVPIPTALPTSTPRPDSGGSGSGGSSGGSSGGTSPTATPTTAVSDVAWRGEYFANATLSGSPSVVQTSTDVNFDWGTTAPFNLPVDQFSARWTRVINFPSTGVYRFYAFVDDGVRVYVDNQLVIDEWREATGRTYQRDISLTAGNHTVRVEYYENAGAARIRVWWEQPTVFPQWRGEYFNNQTLTGNPVLVRNDGDLDFDWGGGSPDASLPADGFSARWTRSVNLNTGTYTFYARFDDGLRLYVNDTLVLDDWRNGSERQISEEINVTGGVQQLRVEYYEGAGDASVEVWWVRESTSGGGNIPTTTWRGEYYDNPDLSGEPTLVRNDNEIDFNWRGEAPDSSLPADQFSVRWLRNVDFPDGRFLFRARADDGVRVYVDGQLLIDQWNPSWSDTTYEAEIDLADGVHTIEVHYYEAVVNAEIRVWWEPR